MALPQPAHRVRNMTVVFRLDARPEIGAGHLSRCSTLAAVLMARGCKVLFILRAPAQEIAGQIRATGADLSELPAWENTTLVDDLPHAAWRGGSQEDDAAQSGKAISAWGCESVCDWLVVDHYGLDKRWESAMRPFARNILAVDDLADRPHDADVLVDVNAYLAPEQRYASLMPPGSRLLLGPRYAMLRDEFNEDMARTTFERPDSPHVINISFGGADPPNLTGKVLSAIAHLGHQVDVVLGSMNRHAESLKEEWGGYASIRFHQDARNMAHLFQRAHLAIGAAGSTTWERMRMGLPSLLYSLADNQTRIGEDAALYGAGLYLGHAEDFCRHRLSAAVRDMLADRTRRLQVAAACKKLVPPGGSYRVANAMMPARLRITIASDPVSWMNNYIEGMIFHLERLGHAVQWKHNASDICGGDLCFLLSFGQLIPEKTLHLHRHNLVVHASDLPRGRGWSPATWQILEGRQRIPVTLLEAVKSVDAGPIYLQEWIHLTGFELVEEWRHLLAETTIKLCLRFVEGYLNMKISGRHQTGEPTYYPRRQAHDSQLAYDKPLSEQFNLLRVCDNDLYPAFFDAGGARYFVRVSRK